jgi:phage baseplate assembly protein gpV
MIRNFFPVPLALWLCACSSSSSSSGSPSPDGGNASCPSVAGTWNITAHCDASFIGQSVVVTQTDCTLSFAAPFNGFTGTVTSDDKLTLSGPQTCTGMVTASSISMTCTPGTCVVTLAR